MYTRYRCNLNSDVKRLRCTLDIFVIRILLLNAMNMSVNVSP